jgi:hypothetical protein
MSVIGKVSGRVVSKMTLVVEFLTERLVKPTEHVRDFCEVFMANATELSLVDMRCYVESSGLDSTMIGWQHA